MEVSNKEFEKYSQEFDIVSDVDYGYNNETGEFDVPSIEWCGVYGIHWSQYETEEQRSEVLREHEQHMNKWVLNYRLEQEKKREETKRKNRQLRELKTLGAQCPQLKELLNLV